jgi:DNA-binding PadR family transcriptional regulator
MPTNYSHYANALPLLDYYILAVLARRPLYAYALREQIQHDSVGAVLPARASLQNALKRLATWGLVTPDAAIGHQDSRRGAYYILTSAGNARLKREIAHLERAVCIGNRVLEQKSQRVAPNSS